MSRTVAKSSQYLGIIRLDDPSLEYFKRMAEESGIPYQTLVNMYLRDCAQIGRKIIINWR